MTEPKAQTGTHEEFPCQQCGAKLQFAPGSTNLECPYCGHTQQIAAAATLPVVERSFEQALLALRHQPVSTLAENGHEISCNGCGAITMITAQASACPFCDSPVIVPITEDRATIVPESVLPFAIDARTAGEKFKGWVTSRWFAPSDLAAKARRVRMDGVYLPYYTYDALAHAAYHGQRGTYYYVTETYRDSEGKTQTRQVSSPLSITLRLPSARWQPPTPRRARPRCHHYRRLGPACRSRRRRPPWRFARPR